MDTKRMALLFAALAPVVGAAHAEVKITDAWVRGTTQTQTASGAFMSITSSEKAALVGAASPIAGKVEIHEMRTERGMMHMRRVERIELPARNPVVLGPGGYHLMLMGLKQRLVEGASVPLVLTVAGSNGHATDVPINVTVAPITAQHSPANHGH